MALTDLKNIPKVMRKYGWYNGARLMDIWFSRPAKAVPAYTEPVTDVVTMNWALGFPRARSVYDRVVSEEFWDDDEVRDTMGSRLRRDGLLIPGLKTPRAFGNLSRPATELYPDHVGYRAVSYGTEYGFPVLDSMTAALGRFAFWLTAAGTVGPLPNPRTAYDLLCFQVTIKEVAVYIRDSYDFEGFQLLGHWSDDDVSLVAWTSQDAVDMPRVTNATFRDWRSEHNMGGDFLVYTDVLRTTLNSPPTFKLYPDGSAEHEPQTVMDWPIV